MHNFKELRVWQVSMDFATETIDPLTRAFPRRRGTELAGQLRRSSLSIPSNIAEGCGKESRAETVRFFGLSLSSATETESHLIAAGKLKLTSQRGLTPHLERIVVIQKMIRSLMDRLP